jgi:hypothetical protein
MKDTTQHLGAMNFIPEGSWQGRTDDGARTGICEDCPPC